MIKNRYRFLPLFLLFLFFTKDVFASGFNLKSIGSLNTAGRQISHWWYTGSTPTLNGEATAGETITISVDGTEGTAIADSEGNWSYKPEALGDGDHEVILSNGESTIKFTLTMGAENVDWGAVDSEDTETLPTAGVLFPTLGLTAIGGLFVFASKKIAKKI